jgi:uncharacterized protein
LGPGADVKAIDVGSVLAAGRELEVREAVEVPAFGSYEFAAPAAVALDIRRVGQGLDVRGTIEVPVAGQCARCLDDVRFTLNLPVDERIEAGETPDPLAENNVLNGDDLDLHDLIRQLIDSALPMTLLCTDDCRGLCAACGQKRDGSCRCAPAHPE